MGTEPGWNILIGYKWLVGGLEHFLFFHSVGNVIIPSDFHSIIFHIVQRGRRKTTSYLKSSMTDDREAAKQKRLPRKKVTAEATPSSVLLADGSLWLYVPSGKLT